MTNEYFLFKMLDESWHNPELGFREKKNYDGMCDRKRGKRGNTMGEIIETEKDRERERVKERSWEKSLKGHPGFRLSPRPPSHPSSFRG